MPDSSNARAARDRSRRSPPGDRGRDAERPSDLPRRGWRDIGWRVWEELVSNKLSMLAAGVAFYGFLALFPGLIALVAIYGLVADPAGVQNNIVAIDGLLPDAAQAIVHDQLISISQHSSTSLSFTLLISVAIAWWSTSSAMKAMMEALNIAYGEVERRSFFRFNLTALGLTLGSILMMIWALFGVVVVPIIVNLFAWIGLPAWFASLISLARWPIMATFIMFGLAVLYRFGPSRQQPKWRWVSWGAAATTTLWLIGSALFSLYVSTFGTYNKTYGSLAAVAVLLLWLDLTAYLIILGAQLNAEMEHQTVKDTTVGPDRPMGLRNAYVADTVGHIPLGRRKR